MRSGADTEADPTPNGWNLHTDVGGDVSVKSIVGDQTDIINFSTGAGS